MRAAANVFKVLMWIAFVITTFFQVLALIGILMRNQKASGLELWDEIYNPFFFIAAIVLVTLGVILFSVFKKRKYIGVCISSLSSLLFVILAFDMSRKFAEQAMSTGFLGLTMADAVLRHMTPALVTVFMLVAWLLERQWRKSMALASMFSSVETHYDLSGKVLFTDDRGKNRDNGVPMTQKERRKMKREEERARRRRRKEMSKD